ncbi:MAG: hypothetical protein HY763_04910 [Planctomycetes bacterium]|nr:hypothetical protein [Planctomycetota bacterium]
MKGSGDHEEKAGGKRPCGGAAPGVRRRPVGNRVGGARCLSGMALLAGVALIATGCKAAHLTEVRGKTSFGPEFRNRGNNTSEIRYDARQALEFRLDNGWTTGLTYRRRDIDGGSGDNENLFLFEVGYPIWRAPKKEDAAARRITQMEKELQELRDTVADLTAGGAGTSGSKRPESDRPAPGEPPHPGVPGP